TYSSEIHKISRFDYKERFKKSDTGPWGNAAFAFASRLIHSFATTRWCINISGDTHGKVEGLMMRDKQSRATSDQKIPTEILISDRRETELVNWGFLPLTVHKGANSAAFYSANSVQSKQLFPDTPAGKKAAINNFLGSQISYLIIICRLSHYIKMMQREHIGTWKNRSEIHNELNDWLRQYVADMDSPTASVRARRPLRHAQVNVEEVEGKAGWYLVQLAVTPHLKYMGSSFTLKESGKLDKFS
ncbi:MAG: type VI secretion system protein ImpC, partial [Neolewinella sp.]